MAKLLIELTSSLWSFTPLKMMVLDDGIDRGTANLLIHHFLLLHSHLASTTSILIHRLHHLLVWYVVIYVIVEA